MSGLDQEYGIAIEPQPNPSTGIDVYAWEALHQPVSLTVLDAYSARRLRTFMMNTVERWEIGQVLSKDIIIIWVVADDGQLCFAIEEMFFDGSPTGLPKFQKFELTHRTEKLGHPALLECGKGRIGGEISLDTQVSVPQWTINRHSGRYGLHDSRKFVHLRNAANRFREHGIDLKESWDFF